MKMYWVGVRASATPTSEDLGAAGLVAGLQFRISLTAKTGDTLTSMAGYSDMVSYVETSGTATIVTKAIALSKVNYGNLSNAADLAAFMTRHSECAGLTLQTIMQCSLTKADTDLTATVIQHVMYSDTAVNQMESMMKGMWVGAGVNSFQMAMTCSSYSSSQYGGSSSSGTAPAFSVTMSGTPHFKSDGVSLNRGSMKAFVTADVAKKCFGNSAGTSTLADIAKALTVSRTEAKEGTFTVSVQSTAVTSPVEGIIVTVADMTFSNPEYTIKSTLSAYMAGAGSSSGTTTGGTSSGSTSSGSTSSYSISKKGSKATLKIVLGSATTVKIYLKTKGVAKLIKSLSGKKGTNTYVTTWKSGYSFIIRSKTGTQLAVLK